MELLLHSLNNPQQEVLVNSESISTVNATPDNHAIIVHTSGAQTAVTESVEKIQNILEGQ